MSTTHDEVAGVVDLFGALSRPELAAALDELAFKQGRDVDDSALHAAIERAIDAYAIVEYRPVDDDAADGGDGGSAEWDDGRDPLLAVGPTAFPSLPPNAEDLPHILDYERRSVDRERLADGVRDRLTAEATAAAEADDAERAAELLDVSYDLETWAAVDCAAVRSTLESALPQD
ncbi:MAG: DUF7109 family protein [Halohasta sp.]